jgi:hypothetical protein
MKRFGFVSIAVSLLLALTVAAPLVAQAGSGAFDASKFPGWLQTNGIWRTVVSTSFKEGIQYAPNDDKLKTIMKMASLTPTSVGKTDYFLVVLKDVKQQVDVVGKDKAHSGTVTVLVFGDRLLPTESSLGKHPQQLDRGYYNVGIVSGYLNLAAVSQGFGTHFYMTTEYAAKDKRKLTLEETYLKDKRYRYTLGYDANKQGDAKGQVFAYGNLKFVCAIVIGTLDEKAQTKLTDHGYPENWIIAK